MQFLLRPDNSLAMIAVYIKQLNKTKQHKQTQNNNRCLPEDGLLADVQAEQYQVAVVGGVGLCWCKPVSIGSHKTETKYCVFWDLLINCVYWGPLAGVSTVTS